MATADPADQWEGFDFGWDQRVRQPTTKLTIPRRLVGVKWGLRNSKKGRMGYARCSLTVMTDTEPRCVRHREFCKETLQLC